MIVTKSLLRTSGVTLFAEFDDAGTRSDVRLFTTGAGVRTITVAVVDTVTSTVVRSETRVGNYDETFNNVSLNNATKSGVKMPHLSFALGV